VSRVYIAAKFGYILGYDISCYKSCFFQNKQKDVIGIYPSHPLVLVLVLSANGSDIAAAHSKRAHVFCLQKLRQSSAPDSPPSAHCTSASPPPLAPSPPPCPLPPGSPSWCSTRVVPASSVRLLASARLRRLLIGGARVSGLDPALIYSSRPPVAGTYTPCARRSRLTTGRSSSTTGTRSRSSSTSPPW
jgi:hypothetical protein